MRTNVERVRYANGVTDRRYSVVREGTGDLQRVWVARFEGDWIGAEVTQSLAWSLARGHAVGRGIAEYQS